MFFYGFEIYTISLHYVWAVYTLKSQKEAFNQWQYAAATAADIILIVQVEVCNWISAKMLNVLFMCFVLFMCVLHDGKILLVMPTRV